MNLKTKEDNLQIEVKTQTIINGETQKRHRKETNKEHMI